MATQTVNPVNAMRFAFKMANLANVVFYIYILLLQASQMALVIKNPLVNAGDIRDTGLIPGLGRSPGDGNGNPLQSSCLENPMDRGAWRATVRGVATESDTTERLSNKNKFTYYSLSFRTRKPGMLQSTGLQRIGHN